MRKFFYRVKAGDSVSKISYKFNAPLSDIMSDNSLICEPLCGDVLFIRENGASYTVTPYDTENSVAEKFGVSVQELKRRNGNFPYLFCGMRINA